MATAEETIDRRRLLTVLEDRGRAWLLAACVLVALAADGAALVLALALRTPTTPDSAYSILALLSAGASYTVVGWLVASRRSGNPVGWVLVGVGLGEAVEALASMGAGYGLVAHPGSIPLAAELAWVSTWAWAPGICLLATFSLLMFPDGHLPSRRWLPVAWASVVMIGLLVVPNAIIGWPLRGVALLTNAGEASPLFLVGLLIFPLLSVASVVSVVLRFRRSAGQERQQLKWFTCAAIVEIPIVVWLLSQPDLPIVVILIVAIFVMPLLPAAIGIAILRYRLYDIDTIINRAIVYGLLTAILAGGSAAMIGVGERLFEGVVGPGSDAAIVLTTLTVVAGFDPIRKRLQSLVDRHFKEVRDPAVDLGRFGQDVRRALSPLDHAMTLRRLLQVSVESYGATGGELHSSSDLARSIRIGVVNAEASARVGGAADAMTEEVRLYGTDPSRDLRPIRAALAAVLAEFEASDEVSGILATG